MATDRTVSDRLGRSGTACADCGTTYSECTDLVLDSGRACCRVCGYRDTHDEQKVVDDAVPAQDPNVALARLRDAHRLWERSEALSFDENKAAEQMAVAFADLDAGLVRGGPLPTAWQRA